MAKVIDSHDALLAVARAAKIAVPAMEGSTCCSYRTDKLKSALAALESAGVKLEVQGE